MNALAERWLVLSSEASDTWKRAAMPLSVSPLRTTWTRGRRAGRRLRLRGAEVRGTLSTVPAMMRCRSRTWLRAARVSTVVRNRAAMPIRVSPGRTR